MNDQGRRAHPLALLLATLLLAACGLVDDAPRRLQHAQQALARNDYAAALVSLKAAVERDDTSIAARLAFAQFLFDAGDLAGAGMQLERARALGAGPAMLRRQQIELAMVMRQPTEALRLLDGLDPQSVAPPGRFRAPTRIRPASRLSCCVAGRCSPPIVAMRAAPYLAVSSRSRPRSWRWRMTTWLTATSPQRQAALSACWGASLQMCPLATSQGR